MKYRKKPVIIEAIPFEYHNITEVINFCEGNLKEEESNLHTVGYFIKTLEGNSYLLSQQDMIIKGINGEFYPRKKDIFEKTYELV